MGLTNSVDKNIVIAMVIIIIILIIYFVSQKSSTDKTDKTNKASAHEKDMNNKLQEELNKNKINPDDLKSKFNNSDLNISSDELKAKVQDKMKQNKNSLYSFDSGIDIVSTAGKVSILSTNGGVRAVSTNGDVALMTTNGNAGTISMNGSYKTLSGLDTYVMTKGINKNGVTYQPNINLVSASNKVGLGLARRHGYSEYDYNDNNKEVEEATRLGIYWGDEKPAQPAPSGSIHLDRSGKLWVRTEHSWREVALL